MDEFILELAERHLGIYEGDGIGTLSVVKRTKQAKMEAAGAAIAIKMAKDAGDPLYKKYLKFAKLHIALKKKLMQKYGPRSRQAARQLIFRKD